MKKPALKDKILVQIRSAVLELLPGSKIILFGSRARNDADDSSDYDLLVISNLNIWNISNKNNVLVVLLLFAKSVAEQRPEVLMGKLQEQYFQLAKAPEGKTIEWLNKSLYLDIN